MAAPDWGAAGGGDGRVDIQARLVPMSPLEERVVQRQETL
ncbi:hypothetical protein [Azospirillum endophyticum]